MSITRTEAQKAVIANRGGTLLVSAAAGSGKTSVLVERLLDRMLGEGLNINAFLIITFTKAAAQELRLRIARAISDRLRDDPHNHHLQRQRLLLYQTQISTIHALCTNLLREWGHSLDIPLDFSLCEQEDAALLMQRALQDVLEERYESITPDAPFARLLDLLSAGRDDSRLQEITLDIYDRMQSHADPQAWMAAQQQTLALRDIDDVAQTPWGQLLLEDSRQQLSYWIKTLRQSITRAQTEESLLPYAENLEESLTAILAFHEATQVGWDAAAACAQIPFSRLKSVRNCPNPQLQDEIKQLRNRCKDAMAALAERFADSSDLLLSDLRLLYPALLGLFDLVRDFSTHYDRLKARHSYLDFSDLEHKTVALLTDANGQPTQIAQLVGKRYAEIMVDEYQDTNQVQNSIISALSQQEENLFFVGDVKQSIYRFRLADPGIFLEKYQRFAPYQAAKAREARKILLSQNFRSRPAVLDAVNALFYAIMSEQLGEMNYTADEALYPGASFPEASGCETELHVLNYADTETEGEEQKTGHHEREARFVAQRIKELLQMPLMISDGAGGTRPLEADDVVILLRSPGNVRHHYARALRDAQIPWAAEDEDAFFDSTEVSVILSFLRLIDNPEQDIALLSVLHSPLYGFDAEDLAQLRQQGEGNLYQALQQAGQVGNIRCAEVLEEISFLRFAAVDASAHELVQALYARTHAIELFRRMPGGTKREENLLRFYDLACRFERNGHRGLFAFLYHVGRLMEHGHQPGGAATADSSGVRLMSIHRSKGLEYPVVFLCGLGRRFNYSDMQKPVLFHSTLGLGPRLVDTERMIESQTLPRQAVALQLKKELLAEEMRLLYVAMTRAKEKLILTHSLSYGESDLKKLGAQVSSPLDPNVLSSQICAGHWIILAAMNRPEGAMLRRIAELSTPPEATGHGLPWVIRYHHGSAPNGSSAAMPTEDAMQAPTDPARESTWQQLTWRYPYEALAAIPAKLTATDLMQNVASAADSMNMSFDSAAFHRPQFAAAHSGLTVTQKGSALHIVMQHIPLEQTGSLTAIAEQIRRLQAAHYLTAEEADAVSAQSIHRFFSSTLGKQMCQAKTLHREYPFSILVPAVRYLDGVPANEKVLLQGVIDCWFETDEGIVLVDFKNNYVTEATLEQTAALYTRQMEAYTTALEEITGKRVDQKILWFLTLNQGFVQTADGKRKKLS